MAYTETDLANVTAAIIAPAKGERVVSVTAGNRTVQYALTDLDKLRALKSEIETELGSSAGRWCFVLTTTSKGLWLRYLKLLDQHGNQISRSSLSGSFEAAGSGRRLGVWGMSSAGRNTVPGRLFQHFAQGSGSSSETTPSLSRYRVVGRKPHRDRARPQVENKGPKP